jgi:hypothetical protein
LKEEALDRTLWRTSFGRGYGPNVRQTAEWKALIHAMTAVACTRHKGYHLLLHRWGPASIRAWKYVEHPTKDSSPLKQKPGIILQSILWDVRILPCVLAIIKKMIFGLIYVWDVKWFKECLC